MGAVGDFLDPSAAVPVTIGGTNASALTIGRTGVTTTIPGTLASTGTFTSGVQNYTLTGMTETVPSASATPLDPTKLVHFIAGTTTINTFTGGVEGQIAIVGYVGAMAITGIQADIVNTIHHNSYVTATAPGVTFTTTGATAFIPYFKQYICTAKMPGFTALQWFEIG